MKIFNFFSFFLLVICPINNLPKFHCATPPTQESVTRLVKTVNNPPSAMFLNNHLHMTNHIGHCNKIICQPARQCWQPKTHHLQSRKMCASSADVVHHQFVTARGAYSFFLTQNLAPVFLKQIWLPVKNIVVLIPKKSLKIACALFPHKSLCIAPKIPYLDSQNLKNRLRRN